MPQRLSRQDGVTLPEILTAIILLALASFAALQAFTDSRAGTLGAQRTEAATYVAQRELETMRRTSYSKLALTTTPTPSSVPDDPDAKLVLNSELKLKTVNGTQENLLVDSSVGSVTHRDLGVQVGSLRLNVFRYVSSRPGSCTGRDGRPLCTNGTKRLTVAVTVDYTNSAIRRGPQKPIWVTSVVTDPADS